MLEKIGAELQYLHGAKWVQEETTSLRLGSASLAIYKYFDISYHSETWTTPGSPKSTLLPDGLCMFNADMCLESDCAAADVHDMLLLAVYHYTHTIFND